MNIWIFNHYAVAPGTNGGTRHYDLAKQLVKRGHNVTIFASSFNHQSRKDLYLEDHSEEFKTTYYDGVRFVWVKSFPYQKNDWRRAYNMVSYTKNAYKIVKQFDEMPDVVIGSLVHPFAAYLGYLVAKKKGCRFYFEERDLWPQTLLDLGKVSERNPLIWVLGKMELFLYEKADRIVVLFNKAPNYVVSRGVKREKVMYLPNGVDLSRYEKQSDEMLPELQQVLGRLDDKFVAVYTGAHGLANNLDTVLDAAKMVKKKDEQIHFLLVGDGPEKARLEKRKVDEGIDNVTFFPPVPKEQIPLILQRVNVGLLPLTDSPVFKWGISPNKMFDYMASSLPVILLCNITESPVELSGGGVVIKENFTENLASSLLEMNATDDAHVKGQKARQYVESNHSWDVLSKQLEQQMLQDI
ncbi:glycosyltransferase family 4 protein [Bacillus tianshenii]|nr:glycosyltransferase family 4 protein [Bacillus tianshenii]